MKKNIQILLFVLLAGVFLYSAWRLGSYYLTAFQQEKTVGSLRGQLNEEDPYAVNEDGILVRYADLYAENHDMVGWLTISDTPIDYPVMQRKDDAEYYLHRDFNGEYASAGCLFLEKNCDAEKPSDNLIIYGHHMKNGNMFGKLQNYEDEKFYRAHKAIVFDTVREHREYQVLSVFRGRLTPLTIPSTSTTMTSPRPGTRRTLRTMWSRSPAGPSIRPALRQSTATSC